MKSPRSFQALAAAACLAAGISMSNAAMVTIGNAGNTADSTGYGDVAYTYQISATEVTIAEAQAATGAFDGNENYWNTGGRTVGTAAPASYVSLSEAMKYCNFITSGNINNGAYKFSGGVYQSTDRASAISTYGTVYALPTEDEWYKAAYYTGNSGDLWSLYANGTDISFPTRGGANGWNYNFAQSSPNYTWLVSSGGAEQNGTYNMMGNVWEWMEDSSGVLRGGSYPESGTWMSSSSRLSGYGLSFANYDTGFRVVAIPEPSTVCLIVLTGAGWMAWKRRKAAL